MRASLAAHVGIIPGPLPPPPPVAPLPPPPPCPAPPDALPVESSSPPPHAPRLAHAMHNASTFTARNSAPIMHRAYVAPSPRGHFATARPARVAPCATPTRPPAPMKSTAS